MARLPLDVAGNSGVMFVAGELGRRGLIALPTIRNTAGIDIMVSEPMGGRSAAIQVKTSQGRMKKWLLGMKSETLVSPTIFYVFVCLALPGELPEFHIVPSRTVASAIKRGHRAWLNRPGSKGQAHNDSTLRAFWDREEKFKDNWAVLGLKTVQ
jgi:hypothetical protein